MACPHPGVRCRRLVDGVRSPGESPSGGSFRPGTELAEYWASRRRKATLPINMTTQRLIEAQDGRCVICGCTLIAVEDRPQNPREWEQWLTNTRRTINTIARREPWQVGGG